MHQLRLVLVLIFALLTTAPFAIAQEPAPYLYYYSHASESFMVEQADGGDSHVLNVRPFSSYPTRIHGPGWSPDGNWFSWHGTGISDIIVPLEGYVISTDGREYIDVLDTFVLLGGNLAILSWSPNSRYLLVSGNIEPCEIYCPIRHYWLVDVAEDELLAVFDLRRGRSGLGVGVPPIEWSLEEGKVTFYLTEEVLTTMAFSNLYRITMSINGVVTKTPISREEYLGLAQPLPELPDVDSAAVYSDLAFTSPSGRYTITPAAGMLTDTQTGAQDTLPEPDFFEGEFRLRMNAAVWHPSEEWVLLGYNAWSSSGIDAVSVFKVDGSVYRELAECGGIGDACVGWLPENVDVARIPAGG